MVHALFKSSRSERSLMKGANLENTKKVNQVIYSFFSSKLILIKFERLFKMGNCSPQ